VTRTLLQVAAALVVGALAFVVGLPDWLRLVVVAASVASIVFALLGLVVNRPAPPLPEGSSTIRLDAIGEQPVTVIRELRRQLGLDLAGAKQAVDGVPTDLATGVARTDAERVADALRNAGATATVTEAAPITPVLSDGPAGTEPE
jgi:ribosomal protein L7/L12